MHCVFGNCTFFFLSIEYNSPFQNEVADEPEQHKGEAQCKYVVGELAGIHRNFLQELVWVSVKKSVALRCLSACRKAKLLVMAVKSIAVQLFSVVEQRPNVSFEPVSQIADI